MAQNKSLFQKELVQEALKQSFVKLNPKLMFKNPVMFLVWLGTLVMFFVSIWTLTGEKSQGSFAYNFTVFIILLLTVLFGNFAEAIAEARGKAQADSLRKTREETPAKLQNGETISSSKLSSLQTEKSSKVLLRLMKAQLQVNLLPSFVRLVATKVL